MEPTGNGSKSSEVIKAPAPDVLTTTQPKITTFSHLEMFQGPLPNPKMLAEYDAVIPGLASKLVSEFEEESKTQRILRTKALNHEIWSHNIGQIGTFSLYLVTLGVCVFLILRGKEIAAIGPVLMAVSVFVGNVLKKKSDSSK